MAQSQNKRNSPTIEYYKKCHENGHFSCGDISYNIPNRMEIFVPGFGTGQPVFHNTFPKAY